MNNLCEDVIHVILDFSNYRIINNFYELNEIYKEITINYVLNSKNINKILNHNIYDNNVNIIKIITNSKIHNLSYLSNITTNVPTILDSAAINYPKILKLLLQWRGVENEFIDCRNNQELWNAVYYGNLESVKILLTWRGPNGEWCDPREMDGNESVGFSYWYFNSKILKCFLDWRGPNDEYINQESISKLIDVLSEETFDGYECLKQILECWRGPDGSKI